MLLAIDIGNTNTVFAVFREGVILDHWRLSTDARRSGDEYAVFLNQVFGLGAHAFDKISDVIISSVVPEARFSISRFCEKHLKQTPVFIDKESVPVELDVDRPEDVGADRLVNAMAVKAQYSGDGFKGAIVIDFGTATTFDVIDARGAYIGGVIAPGINLSLNALHDAAAKLPKVSIVETQKVIGKTTVEAMQSGLYWGYVGLISGLLDNIVDELGVTPKILATGGLAPLFAQNIDLIETIDDQLTLNGLYEIYKTIKN
jgi:type III pantothenate kinase